MIAMKSQIEILYHEYHKNRNIQLNLEQFIYIASLFPSLLVCMSDGKLDKEEWEGVLAITDGLAQNYAADNITVSEEELARMQVQLVKKCSGLDIVAENIVELV